ncbi:hypothetical protein B0H13DRAFT_2332853 [Mycena leptocephala]|nr:hypothetical protein B0H13DRAFT_2332853 [Mycena leptocephala]
MTTSAKNSATTAELSGVRAQNGPNVIPVEKQAPFIKNILAQRQAEEAELNAHRQRLDKLAVDLWGTKYHTREGQTSDVLAGLSPCTSSVTPAAGLDFGVTPDSLDGDHTLDLRAVTAISDAFLRSEMEYMRCKQASEALDDVRHAIRAFEHKQHASKTQIRGLRATVKCQAELIEMAKDIAMAADNYRSARAALLELGFVEDDFIFKTLHNADLVGDSWIWAEDTVKTGNFEELHDDEPDLSVLLYSLKSADNDTAASRVPLLTSSGGGVEEMLAQRAQIMDRGANGRVLISDIEDNDCRAVVKYIPVFKQAEN